VPAPDEIRLRIVQALGAILVEAEQAPLQMSLVEGAGLTVVFEHEGVRCALVIDLSNARLTLSPRELQIARLVARGATNRAIASTLDISSWTVSTHVRRIFAKLGVNNRAEMVTALFAAPEMPSQGRVVEDDPETVGVEPALEALTGAI
jgi:DNA-binding CsgD family transcriptional regulator